MTIYESVKRWLTEITKDQNLTDIDDLTLTRVDGKRRWWRSGMLQPVLKKGAYNKSTGYYELNDMGVNETRVAVGSVDTDVLTCPAGYEYELLFVSAHDLDTAAGYTLELDVDGTYRIVIPDDGDMAINELRILVGGSFQPDAAGNLHISIPAGIFKLRAGEQMRIINRDYVVLDTTTYIWIYRARRV